MEIFEELQARGLIAQVTDDKEIKDLIAYLKLVHNEKDDVSLLRVINYPKRGIGTKSIENLGIVAKNENKSLYESITGGKEEEFKKIIEDLKKEKEKMSLTEFVDLVLDKTGIRESLKLEKTLEADIRLENLEEFKSITRNVEENDGIISLEDFLDELSLVSDASENQVDETDKVTLMTMHAVKGLEFDYVFIVGVEEGLFPHLNSMNSEEELEEETAKPPYATTELSPLFPSLSLLFTSLGQHALTPPGWIFLLLSK